MNKGDRVAIVLLPRTAARRGEAVASIGAAAKTGAAGGMAHRYRVGETARGAYVVNTRGPAGLCGYSSALMSISAGG